MKQLFYTTNTVLLYFIFLLTACNDDDVPPIENEEETITHVTLTFKPQGTSSPVEANLGRCRRRAILHSLPTPPIR